MSRLIARILKSNFVFPLAAVVYLIIWMESWRRGGFFVESRHNGFLISGAAMWAFMGLYWFLLWRKSVHWSAPRISLTLAALPLACAAGGIIFAITQSSFDDGFAYFMASITSPLLWLVATVPLWRESAPERADRAATQSGRQAVVCPTCGYNLTGLNQARCPECGATFTLDQLAASQPQRAEHPAEL